MVDKGTEVKEEERLELGRGEEVALVGKAKKNIKTKKEGNLESPYPGCLKIL